MAELENLRIQLPARAENVAGVRRSVAEHAEKLGASARVVDDLRIVVGEACANVVRHAYVDSEEPGSLEVELLPTLDELRVVIRDRGAGICPRPDSELPSMKMGLPVIGALSESFMLSSVRGGGTELSVQFSLGTASGSAGFRPAA
jgi:anti-sigma regulatory factor (Ser/Thr protein kinase)